MDRTRCGFKFLRVTKQRSTFKVLTRYRETWMTVTQLEKIENRVLRWIRTEARPVSTSQLLDKYGQSREVSPEELRRAVWNLVRDGKAEYTNDRRLVAPK
jgi:hypothetical protein